MSGQVSRRAIPPEERGGGVSPGGVAYLGREDAHGGQSEAAGDFSVGVDGGGVQPEVSAVPPRCPPRRRCPEIVAALRRVASPR